MLAACSAESPRSRVIVLGLDGVDPDEIQRLVSEGKLPHFARLEDQGASGRLFSPPPLLSPVIWTTIATGREPPDHGIGHFTTVDPLTGEELPITSTLRQTRALWNIFSERRRKVAVVGWWATWPAEEVEGVMVSDHAGFHFLMERDSTADSGRESVSFPEGAMAGLERWLIRADEVGMEELRPFLLIDPSELAAPIDFGDDLSHFRWALATAWSYRDIGLELWRASSPDLLMVYIEGVDTTSHLFGHLHRQSRLSGELAEQQRRFGGAVEAMYVLADQIVGDYMAEMDEETTLIVLSDHGFRLGELPLDPSKTRDMRRVSEAYHREEGILFLYGSEIVPGIEIRGATILDITPTVLALAGLPVARDMPGRALSEAVAKELPRDEVASYEGSARPRPAARPARQAEVDKAALEKLRSLGYLGASSTANDRNLASMLLREGRYLEAVRAFRAMVEEQPDDPVLRMSLGTSLAGLGRLEEALEELDRAIELDPLYVPAHHNRGLTLERSGDLEGAVASYRTALRYAADYEPSRRALARLGEAATERVARTETERRAAELLPLVVAAVQRGDYEAAEKLVNEALELTPDVAVVHQYRANVAYLQGDRQTAIEALERALELEPDNALLRANLERLRERPQQAGQAN